MAEYYLVKRGQFNADLKTEYFHTPKNAIKHCVKGMWVIKKYLTNGGKTEVRTAIYE